MGTPRTSRPAPDPVAWGAVVLSGGEGVRLGGVDKAGLEVAGRSLLERALAAVVAATQTVVVGPEVTTSRPVRFTAEEPRGGGPAAALLHGLSAFATQPAVVLVLAVDMPMVGPGTVARLLEALDGGSAATAPDGAQLADSRRQPLCAAYRTAALLAAAPEPGSRHGLSMRSLVGGLRLVAVPAHPGEGDDVDTWDDLRRLRGDQMPDGP